MIQNKYIRASVLSLVLFASFLFVWYAITKNVSNKAKNVEITPQQISQLSSMGLKSSDRETYQSKGLTFEQIKQIADMQLSLEDIDMAGGIEAFGFTTGGAAEEAVTGFPTPSQVWGEAWYQISDPFYDRGPNDKGIGIQLKYSLFRVGVGFFLAILVAVPIGFIIGMSPLLNMALAPFIQILKPISPLAWLPVALYAIKDSEQASIFVIFICSIWPMLINTAFGVANVKSDWVNIARTLELGRLKTVWSVILPAVAPTIFTGMRISLGIAWLVIVAAEMMVGGIGVGYFVWNEWNGLNLASMIFAMFMIGLVGLLLDLGLGQIIKTLQYED